MLKEMQLTVTDMKCAGCESTIRKRLLTLDAVYDVRANYKTGLVLLSVRPEFPLTMAEGAIEELGYTLEAVSQ